MFRVELFILIGIAIGLVLALSDLFRGTDHGDYNRLIDGYVLYRDGVKIWTAKTT